MKDDVYRTVDTPIKPFEFNKKVAAVFPDMIERSVPGYPLTISMIRVLANEYVQPNSYIYDLGCSVGTACFAIGQSLKNKPCRIIAVDNSKAMIEQCLSRLSEQPVDFDIEFVNEDIQQTEIKNASVVLMNFTLQFIPLDERIDLLQKIYTGLLPGGVIIVSEKVAFEDQVEEKAMLQLHERMKSLNGYEQMEIANKRKALEDVLIPETISTHIDRLQRIGFRDVFIWLRCLNFVSVFAVK